MGWRELLSGLLSKATAAQPPAGADPWNYVLAQQLDNRGLDNPARQPAELLRRVRLAFPALPAAEAAAIIEQLPLVYQTGYELGQQVNRQQLAESSATERLQQAFPQISPDNLRKLMGQVLLNTR